MYQLTNLINAGYVTLYIPSFVEREYKTRIFNNVVEKVESNKNNFRSISNEFSRLKRTMPSRSKNAESKSFETLEMLINSNRSLVREMEKAILTDYEDWKNINKVQLLKFDAKLFENIENDYFSGGGVFKVAKNRNDIPDAIIYECIKSLTKRVGKVSFILKDGNFYKKAKSYLINVFKDLHEFYEEPNVKEIVEKLKIGEGLETKILKLVSRQFEIALANYCQGFEGIENIYFEAKDVTEGMHTWFNDGMELHFIHDLNREKLTKFSITSSPLVLSDKYLIDVNFTCEAKVRESMSLQDLDDYSGLYDIISSSEGICEIERTSLVRFQTELCIPVDAFDIDSYESRGHGFVPPLEIGEGVTIHGKRCQIIEEFIT